VGLSGSPFVNINLGASGDCEITAGAFVGCAANDTANAYLVIDGGASESIFGLGSTAASAGNVQSTRRISTWLGTTLTPNVGHSFTHGICVDQRHGELQRQLLEGAAALICP
jgi:hypothetical protein